MAYDTFEDGNYDTDPTWLKTGTGTVAVTEASKKNGVYGLEYSNIAADFAYLDTLIGSLATLDTWTWIRTSDISGRCDYQFVNTSNAAQSILSIYLSHFQYYDSTGFHEMTEIPVNDTWYIFRIAYDGSLTDFYVYDEDQNLIESALNTTPAGAVINIGRIRLWEQNVTGSVYLDDVGYGDRDPPEPAVTGQFMTLQKYW